MTTRASEHDGQIRGLAECNVTPERETNCKQQQRSDRNEAKRNEVRSEQKRTEANRSETKSVAGVRLLAATATWRCVCITWVVYAARHFWRAHVATRQVIARRVRFISTNVIAGNWLPPRLSPTTSNLIAKTTNQTSTNITNQQPINQLSIAIAS